MDFDDVESRTLSQSPIISTQLPQHAYSAPTSRTSSLFNEDPRPSDSDEFSYSEDSSGSKDSPNSERNVYMTMQSQFKVIMRGNYRLV